MMNRRLFAASTAACIMVAAVYPTTSLAAVNMDLKKKVVGMAGIMNVTNTEKNVTRAEYARMVVLASQFGAAGRQQFRLRGCRKGSRLRILHKNGSGKGIYDGLSGRRV